MDWSSSPTIKTLLPVPRQQPQPGVLDGVGILELVHQDVAKRLLVVVEDVAACQQQLVGAQQQLGEVHQPGAIAGLLVEV
jgi:hypothetical protein